MKNELICYKGISCEDCDQYNAEHNLCIERYQELVMGKKEVTLSLPVGQLQYLIWKLDNLRGDGDDLENAILQDVCNGFRESLSAAIDLTTYEQHYGYKGENDEKY